MKLFNAIAAAAVIGASLITVNPAQASLYLDLKEGKYLAINDDQGFGFITDGSDFIVTIVNPATENPVGDGKQPAGKVETSYMTEEFKDRSLSIFKSMFNKFKDDPNRRIVKPYRTVEEAASRYRKNLELPGKKVIPEKVATFKPDYSKDHLPQHQPRPGAASGGSCPSGQRMYRTKGLFGIGARNIGCMTAYEAESLRRQQVQNIQRNIQNSQPRNCYGTATSFGNTTYGNATCY